MNQHLALISLLVNDYGEAIEFFVGKLGFTLEEDQFLAAQNKRWVVIKPPGAGECKLLLAKASSDEQRAFVGKQCGGRVFLFLHTDDFYRDHEAYQSRGVKFLEEPREEPYGTVAVFEDLYGNRWDLLQPK